MRSDLLHFFCHGSTVMWVMSSACFAADLRVGRDTAFPTIHHAIKSALPGDTIHLEPRVYEDYAGFYGKKGEAGKPITLDGHGATLEGSDPLKPEQWKEVAPGRYEASQLLPRLDDAILGRWFFVMDGKMQLMGRTSKGKKAAFKQPSELVEGEWTFLKGPTEPDDSKGEIHGSFFIQLAAGVKLSEAKIRVPVRSAGVQFSGDNAHLVIKNLTATHPYNDGFNIHGDCRACVFENIRAIECGDDGISAHESAQYEVRGFMSRGNSTGICDTGTAQTSYSQLFISGCHAFDLYFLDEGRYEVRDALVLSSAQNPFMVTGRATGLCQLKMKNVLVRRLVEPRLGIVAARAHLIAEDCTWEGMDLKTSGSVEMRNCKINGQPFPAGTSATGAKVEELMKLEALR
jgi:hypothetical protein